MGKTLIDFIVEPYLLLFIEYLDDPGICICNNYSNDVYHLSLINKEVHSFMARYNKISMIYPEKTIPKKYQRFFGRESYCKKHDIPPPLKSSHINMIFSSIRNIMRSKDDSQKPKIFGNLFLLKEFIHCKTVKETQALKQWILQHTPGLVYKDDCCDGLGFAIELLL